MGAACDRHAAVYIAAEQVSQVAMVCRENTTRVDSAAILDKRWSPDVNHCAQPFPDVYAVYEPRLLVCAQPNQTCAQLSTTPATVPYATLTTLHIRSIVDVMTAIALS